MIGELDTFLEEIEADEMEVQERAEFIRYLISRGMFDKAYLWIRRYGIAGVNPKSLARLISKNIIILQVFLLYFLRKYDICRL